jgi:molybdopterin converting factor small subunit
MGLQKKMGDIRVKVLYPAIMQVEATGSGSFVSVPEGTTVKELLTHFRVKEEHHRYIIAVVDGEKRGLSYTLRNQDELRLLLPVGGG